MKKKLLHANKDQINVVSQFTLNMLKKKIPLPPTDRGQTWAAGMRVGPCWGRGKRVLGSIFAGCVLLAFQNPYLSSHFDKMVTIL